MNYQFWSTTAGSYFVSGFGSLPQSNVSSSGDVYEGTSGQLYRAAPYYPETSTWLGYHDVNSGESARQSSSDSQPNYQIMPEQVAGEFDDGGRTAVAGYPSLQPEDPDHAFSTHDTVAPIPRPLLPRPVAAAVEDSHSSRPGRGQKRPRAASETTVDSTTARRGRRRRAAQPSKAESVIFKSENQKTLDRVPGSSGPHIEDDVGGSNEKAPRRDRARHNSVERKYRMGLNKKLFELRAALPALKPRSASEADVNDHGEYDTTYSPRFSKVCTSSARVVKSRLEANDCFFC